MPHVDFLALIKKIISSDAVAKLIVCYFKRHLEKIEATHVSLDDGHIL